MAGKLTQTQTVAVLAEQANVSKKDAKEFLGKLSDLAHKEAKKNGEFTIPGIGKLVKQKRKARMGRNPATGASIHINASNVPKFKAGKALKEACN